MSNRRLVCGVEIDVRIKRGRMQVDAASSGVVAATSALRPFERSTSVGASSPPGPSNVARRVERRAGLVDAERRLGCLRLERDWGVLVDKDRLGQPGP